MKKTGVCPQCGNIKLIEKMGGIICANCRLVLPDALLFADGDLVNIRSVGHNYDMYTKWAKRYDIYWKWKDHHSPSELAYAANHDHRFVIRISGPHSSKSDKTIYAIEDLETGYYYIVGPEAIVNTGERHFYDPIILDEELFEI